MEYVLNKFKKRKNNNRYSNNNTSSQSSKYFENIRYSISNRNSKNNIDIYYLLYKIKNSNILWIVKIDEDLDIILQNHKKIINTDNEDYIVVKRTQPYDFKFALFKQFKIFILTDDCEIIYNTQHVN